MNVVDFIASAAGGTVLGPVLSTVGRFVNAKWIIPAETKAEVDKLTAQRNAAADASAWAAFAASQQSEAAIKDIPENTWPWVSSLYVGAEALRKLVRPLLTIMGFPMVAWVYYTLDNPAALPAQVDMAKEINFMVFVMWSWWFGERYTARSRAPIALMPKQ